MRAAPNRAKMRLAEERYRESHRSILNARRRARYKRNRAKEASAWQRYRAEHQEELRAYYRAKAHLRRALGWDTNRKAAKAAIMQVLAEARFGSSLYLDAYSGRLISDPTIDHIVPLSKGGTNAVSNLCATSFANNRSKGSQPLLVWMCRR